MKIYVGNIPFSMDEGQIRTTFEEFGEVESIKVIMDNETGRPRGFAFIEMPDQEGRQAIQELNERVVEGRPLKVNEARPRENRNRGRSY